MRQKTSLNAKVLAFAASAHLGTFRSAERAWSDHFPVSKVDFDAARILI